MQAIIHSGALTYIHSSFTYIRVSVYIDIYTLLFNTFWLSHTYIYISTHMYSLFLHTYILTHIHTVYCHFHIFQFFFFAIHYFLFKGLLPPQNENCQSLIITFLFFFPYKKYSRSFIMLRLNHWWQMEYSDHVFYTFLGLDSGNCLAVNGTVTSLPVFIQNILNCVLKMNEAFTGLEQHGVSD